MSFSWEAALGAAAGFAIGGPAGAAVGFGMGNSISSARDAADAQKAANAENIGYARETNATAIELANTAHQREMADLKAAGLNPILSAKYGGAATPSLQTPKTESLAPTILSSAKQTNDVASTGASVSLQSQLVKSQVSANSAQAVKSGQEARRLAMENDVLEQKVKSDREREAYRARRGYWLQHLGTDVHDVLDTINPFKGLFMGK